MPIARHAVNLLRWDNSLVQPTNFSNIKANNGPTIYETVRFRMLAPFPFKTSSQPEITLAEPVRPIYRKAPFESILSGTIMFSFRGTYPSHIPHCVFYIVGAPRERAEHIFQTIYKYVDKTKVQLRWWNEDPPDYGVKDLSFSQWQGYNPEQACFVGLEKNTIHDASAHNVILLYYRNGHDAALVMEEAFRGEYHLFTRDSLILPIAEYIFDPASCERILISKRRTAFHIRTRHGCYFAPVPVRSLEDIFPVCIFLSGNGKCLLGEIDSTQHKAECHQYLW